MRKNTTTNVATTAITTRRTNITPTATPALLELAARVKTGYSISDSKLITVLLSLYIIIRMLFTKLGVQLGV